jgi:hypothetical protein
MMLVKGPEGVPPSPELMAAIGKLGEEMARAGKLVEMGGLAPSAQGARIRLANATLTVIDGPFTESKELVGGYAVLEAASRAEALELGRRFMQVHAENVDSDYVSELEIREIFGQPSREARS